MSKNLLLDWLFFWASALIIGCNDVENTGTNCMAARIHSLACLPGGIKQDDHPLWPLRNHYLYARRKGFRKVNGK